MDKIGDKAFVFKFRKIFIKPSSNDWNKLSVETVEQKPIFKFGVDHKRGRAQFPVKAADWTQQGKIPFEDLHC